jgi:ABC-type transporter Mla subunit MlaD
MKELDNVMAELKVQYAEIEKMLNDLIAKQTSDQAADKLEKLKESLKNLADNIAVLESQRQKISDQIEQLEGEMQQYASVIDTASATLNQLQTSLASAAAIADVESLTASVTKAYNTLSHDGVADYNLYVENYSTVIKNLNTYIDNVNIVNEQAYKLKAAVEHETTAIASIAVDESEVVSRYDMKGNPVDSTYKGIQIIRLKNGKTIKLNVK